MNRPSYDLAILDVGEQLEPGNKPYQDRKRRRFERYVVARKQVQRDDRKNQYGNAVGVRRDQLVWCERLQSVPCRLR